MSEPTTGGDKTNPFDKAAKPKEPTISELADALAGLEAQVEALGKNSELSTETVEYVQALRSEERWNWWIRLAVLLSIGAFIFSLWWHLLLLILNQPFQFFMIGENARVALIAGISIISTLFIVTVLRGVYRIAYDRHTQRMPEHLEVIARSIGENSN